MLLLHLHQPFTGDADVFCVIILIGKIIGHLLQGGFGVGIDIPIVIYRLKFQAETVRINKIGAETVETDRINPGRRM